MAEVGSHLTLSLRSEVLAEPPLEGWLREHLIGESREPAMYASDLLGATAYDRSGQRLGRVADLITEGTPVIRAVLVAPGRRARLLG
ncbi:PRC-barrel domain-containing protein [Amycolatopsis sp. cmx-4-83]|uniref:PRC-barrel domain-containing protein n=1 Tax=Amycolatopsis sp. cmx-4-83 TaxID=2790940 RepID=UPI00397D04CA